MYLLCKIHLQYTYWNLISNYKAMLKSTYTFYRCIRFTCDKFDKTHVKTFSHLNCKRKACTAGYPDKALTNGFHWSGTLQKKHWKKPFKIKIPPFDLNESRKFKPMTEPLSATGDSVNYGGNYNDSNNKIPIENWRKKFATATTGEGSTKATNIVPANFRGWETVSMNTKDGTALKFKVLSYNVLAQCLLERHPELYTECSPHNLKWDVRANRLYDEIINYSPDILCLQEVQASHLYSFYTKFEKVGYTGIFKQKTGSGHDGCAIYFKKSLFKMIDYVSVEFYQPELPILNRDNIGVMVKLMPHDIAGPPIVIATTHLLYNPRRTDVRLAQMQVLLAEIDRFAYDKGQKYSHLPIILTGDFNSTPDSVVITLLDRGHVNVSQFRDSSDWKRVGVTDNCQHISVYLNRQYGHNIDVNDTYIQNSEHEKNSSSCSQQPDMSDNFSELFNSSTIGHALQFRSVYDKLKTDGTYEATTFQDYWITVDYIYYSRCSPLKLLERLRLPSTLECEVLGCLPNDIYGSDHLALGATFELKSSMHSEASYR